MRKILAVVLALGLMAAAAQAQGSHPQIASSVGGDDFITLVYSPEGTLNISHPSDETGAAAMTTLEIKSTGDFFIGPKPAALSGTFDVWTPVKAFKLEPAGFTSLDLGQVQAGLTAQQLVDMLTVDGSFVGGGPLTGVNLFVVPEPTSLVLLGICSLFLFRRR
jgi:hypothetical protein